MSATVEHIIELIDRLPDDDRMALEILLSERAEDAWQKEAKNARRAAAHNGLDQQAIDDAINRQRQGG